MAFVVITYLHPEHESHLAELLQRHTSMPTTQVQERVKVEGNHVYVIPPNRSIIMTDTHLPTGQSRNFLASVRYIKVDGTDTLVSTYVDITKRERAERQVRSLASDLTAAEQEERKRISQILHDDLQQRIFAVKVQLSTLYDAYRRGDMQSVQLDMDQLQNLLDESISITCNLSIDLSPASLQGDSLVDALDWPSNQMREQYGLNVNVVSNGISTRFEDTLRILLFHAVREALFNVVKHAGTLNASVSFEDTEGHICLTISDEGAGFPADAAMNRQGA